MADGDSAKKAIQDPNPVIDGRKANVNLAYLGAKPRGVQGILFLLFLLLMKFRNKLFKPVFSMPMFRR